MIKNIDHANVIHYGFDSIILKSGKNGLSKPSCVKVLKDEFPSKEMLAQLDNEFELCSKTKSSNVRKAYRREKVEGHEALVLEYIEGKDLNKFLASKALTLFQQLHIATDIASALADLQKENICHHRIHPSNILVEESTNKIYLIDFALATQGAILEEAITSLGEKEIESLKYIAPEQTGRINHTIDQRADLYSLGLIFYKLFTGQLPFDSEARLELLYANIAKTPLRPENLNPQLPKVLGDIIMKLLSKNAEDRYQSAFGVKADLERCLAQLNESGDIDDLIKTGFTIALGDYSGKLSFSKKLYGRDNEIKTLTNLYDSCALGQKKNFIDFRKFRKRKIFFG